MNAARLREIRERIQTNPVYVQEATLYDYTEELLAYVDTLLAERKRLKRRIKDSELAYDFKSSLEPVRWTGMSKH